MIRLACLEPRPVTSGLFWHTFDTYEDSAVTITEIVRDCTQVAELITAIQIPNVQDGVS